MTTHDANANIETKSDLTVDTAVRRGEKSWTFIYIALGFAISIEGVVIGMLPLSFPWNIILYAVAGCFTFKTFLDNRRFQDKLLAWQNDYESTFR